MDQAAQTWRKCLAEVTSQKVEFVWGPGDNGLDEILVQYDTQRKAFWMIQDGGGDVVAMCDLQGAGGVVAALRAW